MDRQTQEQLLKIVQDNYEEIADDFSETRKKYLWPELVNLAGQVKDGDSVLDAGCGNGRLIKAFQDKRINYIGIDNSEKLIKLAKEKYGPQNFQFSPASPSEAGRAIFNFQFLVGDILALGKFIDKRFDYIFCIAVLHHIPGEDLRLKALNNLKEKLADNGKIVLTVWNLRRQKKFRWPIFKFTLLKLIGKNKMDWGDIVFDWKNSAGQAISQRYYHAFNVYGLKKIIKKAGLNIGRIYKDKYNYYVIASRAPLQMGHMRIK